MARRSYQVLKDYIMLANYIEVYSNSYDANVAQLGLRAWTSKQR